MTKAEFKKMVRDCRRVYVGIPGAHDAVYIQAVKADIILCADDLILESQQFTFSVDDDDNDLYIN